MVDLVSLMVDMLSSKACIEYEQQACVARRIGSR